MSGNRLLIIDDEPEISAIVTKVAKGCGYEVKCTTSAKEFRSLLATWRPTHVSLDLHMPDTDGVEIIRQMAADRSDAQVLLMSGFDAKVVESARRLGTERGLAMAGTLLKPVRVAELQQLLLALKFTEDAVDETALARAIEGHELFMLYQPKVHLDAMDVSHFEALSRWRLPSGGMLGPEKFISVAERSGLIGALTREVARQVVDQVGQWRRAGYPIAAAINISGKDLSDVGFADELKRLCQVADVQPGWVTLELTETAAAANAADAIDILTRLRLMGFHLSIDDFGTGYSSLTQLHRLPFSEIKIDREFVKDCATSSENRVIVKTIIDLGHNLGLSVVAEGAEDEATVEHLRALRCDYVQGYYFSRPLAAEAATPWVDTWRQRHGSSNTAGASH